MRAWRFLVAGMLVAVATGAVLQVSASPAQAAGTFVTLASPARLLDTRGPGLTADGAFSGLGLVGTSSRQSVQLTVRGRAGVPADATAVALNVTVTGSQSGGYVTLWPGGAQPPTSTLNFASGQTIANAAVVGTSGSVRLYASTPTHLIVDITGYFSGTGTFTSLGSPARLADTRNRPAGPLTAGETLQVPTAGVAGIPNNAAAAALNVTVTGAQQPGFLTVYPCGATRPNASSLNYGVGDTVANAVIARPGSGGRVCVFASGAAHVIVDVGGSFPAGGPVDSLAAPARVLDTRPGATTVDTQFAGGGMRSSNSVLQLRVAGRAGVPAGATAVVLNVTVTGAQGPGYVTAYPAGITRPDTSNVNYSLGQTIPNAVIAGVGPDGSVCLFVSADTQLIADVTGYLTGSRSTSSSTSCSPTTGGGTTPEPNPGAEPVGTVQALIAGADELRYVGADQVAVWVCLVPRNSTGYTEEPVAATAEGVALWATTNVTSYYRNVSRNRYVPWFTAMGTIELAPGDTAFECNAKAAARTEAPFTNVLAVSNRADGGGFAGPGSARGLADGPPSETGRGMYLGGGTVFQFPSPTIAVHELGHTLSWPHSYLGSWEYDNSMDMMSGDPVNGLCTVETTDGRYRYPCEPQHTVAFNRLAAGWIDDSQVQIHTGGTATYTLAPPAMAGVQLVAAPHAADEQALMTIEARPSVGYDRFADAEGVVVHRIDQRGTACGDDVWDGRCSGIVRRVAQARGPADQGQCGGVLVDPCSTAHVIGVGESMTVNGVTIRVDARVGDSYRITVTGTYRAPSALPQLVAYGLSDRTNVG